MAESIDLIFFSEQTISDCLVVWVDLAFSPSFLSI